MMPSVIQVSPCGSFNVGLLGSHGRKKQQKEPHVTQLLLFCDGALQPSEEGNYHFCIPLRLQDPAEELVTAQKQILRDSEGAEGLGG